MCPLAARPWGRPWGRPWRPWGPWGPWGPWERPWLRRAPRLGPGPEAAWEVLVEVEVLTLEVVVAVPPAWSPSLTSSRPPLSARW